VVAWNLSGQGPLTLQLVAVWSLNGSGGSERRRFRGLL